MVKTKVIGLLLSFLLIFIQIGPSVNAQEYVEPVDLLIITHINFTTECERLSAWKNSTGMSSVVVSWQEFIYPYSGADLPERIKKGIADWQHRYRIKYVLLMGDSDVLPVKYITMDWNCHTPEPDKFSASDVVFSASDLYYADLYNASEDFADWDFDKNGYYGELLGAWKFTGVEPINYDRLDMFPDVAVGRVPASTEEEVSNYIDKVISYETNADIQLSSWLRESLMVANGVNDLDQYVLSGNVGADLVSFGYTNTRFYDVDMLNLPRPFSHRPNNIMITNELNYGKGYVNFAGHGNPGHLPSFGPDGNDYSVWFSYSLGSQFNTSILGKNSFCFGDLGLPMVGDYDGDNDTDLYFFDWNGTLTLSVNPLTEHSYDLYPYFKPTPGFPKIGDFDGDNQDDLVQVNITSGEVYICTANSVPSWYTTTSVWMTGFLTSSYSWYVGDFNGDSMDDIAYRDGTQFRVARSTGSGFMTTVPMFDDLGPDEIIVPGDYDGDFNVDIALIDAITGDVRVATSNGQLMEIDTSYNYGGLCPGDIPYGARILSGDCQGYGYDCLVLFLKDSRIGGRRTDATGTNWELGDVYVLVSDGIGWCACTVWHEEFCLGDKIPAVGDFNGDSKDDIVLFNRYARIDPFDNLRNKDMYPIIFAASCSTAEYAIIPPWSDYEDHTLSDQIGSNNGHLFPYSSFHGENVRLAPGPYSLQDTDVGCIMERFLVQSNSSGAVAYIGGVEVLQTFVNDLNRYFVEAYVSGENILGEMWNDALDSYLTAKGFGHGEHALYASDWGDVAEYHHPSKVTLFGDPSLRVFDTPEPTTPPPVIITPTIVFVIGGTVVAIGIVFLFRRSRLRK
ncbi:hypothetical protein EU528_10830 [Candidatus Thorarchaeota archaeon]|nr:MAG: hypothetical protein EU528_10830 [Candidatus Thorarchaeota archaeon]